MPLYIKSSATTALVDEFARRRGVTKQEAVRLAVRAALDRLPDARSIAERIDQFRADHPLPPRSGLEANKPFYDDLSGDP